MSIDFEVRDTMVSITVAEVDRHTVRLFAAELAEAIARYEEVPRPTPGRCTTRLVIDLSEVTFLDASGLRALIDADQKALQFGGRVLISNAKGVVRRCLEITGLLERFGAASTHETGP